MPTQDPVESGVVTYDMTGFMGQCVERYLELANCSLSDLNNKADTPWLADRFISETDWAQRGTLSCIASNVLMKILYAARACRFDLLFTVTRLARDTTRWTTACDRRMHHLLSYIHNTQHRTLVSTIGDPVGQLQLALFSDADFAGDQSSSKSTSGG